MAKRESYSESVSPSLPSTTSQCVDFRKIMQEHKNEEHVQQKEREARVQNIVVHGFPEPSGPQDNEEDKKIIGELLCIIEVDATPVSIARLGQRNESKSRLIKVKLSSQNEKQRLMNNLIKLKNAVDQFKKISVTDNYTSEERAVIRNKVVEARKSCNQGQSCRSKKEL